jgi:hypothetical protein
LVQAPPCRTKIGGLCGGIDAESFALAASKRDVEVTQVSTHTQGKDTEEALQLGFAAGDAAEIKREFENLPQS